MTIWSWLTWIGGVLLVWLLVEFLSWWQRFFGKLKPIKKLASPPNVVVAEPATAVLASFAHDEELANLNRQATAAKDEKNWARAVGLLQLAKAREGDMYQDTRLALYLQEAGRFDESMSEFDWLLSKVRAQCDAANPPYPPVHYKHSMALRKSKIHDKARLAAKREKRSDLVLMHQTLADQYQGDVDDLADALEAEWQAERRAYEQKEALRLNRF